MQVPQCARRSRQGRPFHSAWRPCYCGRHHDAAGRVRHRLFCARLVCMDRSRSVPVRHHLAPPVLRAHHDRQVVISKCCKTRAVYNMTVSILVFFLIVKFSRFTKCNHENIAATGVQLTTH